MSLSQTPAFNLKVVLKETGIAADTLRAWERRYGIPMPQRTPGGHRLYSQHDIHLIKWLMARQKEGLSISRAVDLWQELVGAGTDPLAGEPGAKPLETSASPLGTGSLENLRLEWLSACQAYNEAGAEQALNQAFALYPVETVVTELIQAGLHEMGEMWQRGQASVQQEHFASALAGRRLEALIAAAPPPTRPEAILLACPAEEWHAFPLLLLSLLLRRRGWNTVYLGANVPLEEMDETIQAVRPALVIMAAQGLVSAAALRRALPWLQTTGPRLHLAGGPLTSTLNCARSSRASSWAKPFSRPPARSKLYLKGRASARTFPPRNAPPWHRLTGSTAR
jgi:DNA-binding transcriptional MerR regulator